MEVTHGTLEVPNDPTPWLVVRPNEKKDYCVLWLQGWTSTIEKHEPGIIPRTIPHAYFEVAKRGNYLVIPATGHAVAKMPEPEKHYAYIERIIADIIGLIQQEALLL